LSLLVQKFKVWDDNVFGISRQGDEGSVGPVGAVGPVGSCADHRMPEAISHTCLSSSAEYELALILKELRWITDQVTAFQLNLTNICHFSFYSF